MIAISATDLTKRYGRAEAVSHVSFEIEHGEIVGFLGPNGAGKTTTLRMLAGLVRPSGGSCQVLGESVPGPNLRRVGTMIEEPSFYPYLSGRDNLRHAALIHGDVPRARVDEVLAFVHMQDAAAKKVKAYSQGMRQRLALARALLSRPEVLLLDEPTNGLDPTQIQHMRELIRELACEATLLISTHILQEVQAVCGRVLIIQHGCLALDARLAELAAARRLLVTVDDRDEAQAMLAELAGVTGVERLPAAPGRACFALAGTGFAEELAPAAAAAVARAGLSLYGLGPEARDLEKIFRDINLHDGREQ